MSEQVFARYKDALRHGHVAVVKGRPREAIGHYEQASELVPDRPLPLVSMGNVYLRMRQPREALAAFERALARAPSDLDAVRGKAEALAAAGREDEAATLRARAAELEAMARAGQRPRVTPDARTVEMERHVANGAAARAAGDLDIAAAAYLTAANGYAAADDFDAAIDACLRALEARPGQIDVHFTMAMLYLRRGWAELGEQRAVLIERRLDIDDDPRRRAALRALARDFRSLGPELERLAAAPA
jgi:hypothetical protein